MNPTQPGRRVGAFGPYSHPKTNTHIMSLITGATLLTMDGDIPVEFLSAGDRVITRNSGQVQVSAVTRSSQELGAVEIRAGSLGDTRPDHDLVVPETQLILIRDWRAQAMFGARQAAVPAFELIDNEFIRDLGKREMAMCHLHFDRPYVLYAGGLELCTAPEQAATRQVA